MSSSSNCDDSKADTRTSSTVEVTVLSEHHPHSEDHDPLVETNNNNNNVIPSPSNRFVGFLTRRSTSNISHNRGEDGTGEAASRRRPFVSRHRQELDRIKNDAAHSRAHPVPDWNSMQRIQHQQPSSNNNNNSSDGNINNEQNDCNEDNNNNNDNSKHSDHGDTGDNNNNYTNHGIPVRSKKEVSKEWVGKVRKGVSEYFHSKTCNDWVETALPAWRWLQEYQWKSTLTSDLIAGMTVGVMVVPQSMSYAKLAGLPVEYGLYSALMPVYAYAMFGSSRQLAVGPVAIISLLLSTGLSIIMDKKGLTKDDPGYSEVYTRLAIQTSFLVGCCYLVMGIARLGFVTIFLSHAVISGFTTGAAVIIGASQLKYILGYDMPRSDLIYEIVYEIFHNIHEFQWKVFLMGFSSICLLVFMKNIGKTFKSLAFLRALGPLTVTVIGIILVAAFDLQLKGIPIVGTIPRGMPKLTIHLWTPLEDLGPLFTVVISITIVGFMESIAIAKQLASKHKYEIDSSQELFGLGISNFMGAMFNAYPVTGSFSRSAVNNESGAKSGVSGIVTATLVALVLLLLTPIFELLPLSILAAIVISAVIGLIDYPEAIYLWKVHKFDFSVWVVACLGTMFLGVEIGLVIAVGVSILIVIYEAAYPHTAVMGRLPGTTVYRNIKQYPRAERIDGIVIVRIDAPLFFANAQNVRDKIRKYRLACEADLARRNAGELKFLIIEMTPVSHMDTSALHILEDMCVNYKSRGQQLVFSNPSLQVMNRLVSSGVVDKIGRQHFFSCSHDAVNWCLREMDQDALSLHHSTTEMAALLGDFDDSDNNNDNNTAAPVVSLATA